MGPDLFERLHMLRQRRGVRRAKRAMPLLRCRVPGRVRAAPAGAEDSYAIQDMCARDSKSPGGSGGLGKSLRLPLPRQGHLPLLLRHFCPLPPVHEL